MTPGERCHRCGRFVSPETCVEGWSGGLFGDYNGLSYCAFGRGCNHEPGDDISAVGDLSSDEPDLALLAHYRGRYGYTARHLRCDRCLRDYMPQHTHRVCRWRWECGNCVRDQGHGIPIAARERFRVEARFRYAEDPRMLAALGLSPAPDGSCQALSRPAGGS